MADESFINIALPVKQEARDSKAHYETGRKFGVEQLIGAETVAC
jgi:hypothetical protein